MEQPNISTPPQTNPLPKPETIPAVPSPTPKFPPSLIATFVLLVVLVGAAGFLLGKSFSQPKTSSPTSISQTSPTPTPETTIPTPTPDPTADWKTYESQSLKFSVRYPPWWVLDHDVLTSYNPGAYLGEKPIPKIKAKCDFTFFNPELMDIADEETILENKIKILKGKGIDKSGGEGPGLGDNIMFLVKDDVQ